MTAETKTLDIVITHTFDAPVEKVWNAWIDPEVVMRWWGPDGFSSPSAEVDFREGGKFIFGMRAPAELGGGDSYSAGIYSKIVPMTRIEFSQMLCDQAGSPIDPTSIGMPADFPAEIPSELHFREIGGKTELTVIEHGWTPGHMRDMSRMGMEQCLVKLAAVLAQ